MSSEVPSFVARRRKVRKGTQSCWQCKQRKTRCTFTSPSATVCDGCKSRRTECLSQLLYDDPRLSKGSVSRIGAVDGIHRLDARSGSPFTVPGRLAPSPGPSQHPNPDVDTQGSFASISQALVEEWPSQEDLGIILNAPIDVSILVHGVVCKPYSECTSNLILEPRRMLRKPSPGCHPVLIGRKLLLLAIFTQGISSSQAEMLSGLSVNYHTIKSRLLATTSRLVTTHHDMLESLDGIECIMLESMFLNNAGNLRKAWLVNRRAMSIAQMMGLHTGKKLSNHVLEVETRDRIDPAYMWFRLVATDRYLSMMLDLPQGCSENVFAQLKVPEPCDSLDRMEHMLTTAAGMILDRNTTERTDPTATMKIDKMLQQAAASMPPKWWAMSMSQHRIGETDIDNFKETVRIMTQFAYYHTLVQLHLPYLAQQDPTTTNHDYSKMTAANSARTILTIFLELHGSTTMTAYCKGVDFVVFIACTALCLAHIQANRPSEASISAGYSALQSLQHQRLGDRGLLERTLEVLETMAQTGQDNVAMKVTATLRPLLKIGNDSMTGNYCPYNTLLTDAKHECESITAEVDDLGALHVHIPHFGAIAIAKRPETMEVIEPQANSFQQISSLIPADSALQYNGSAFAMTEDIQDWALQSVDLAFANIFTNGLEPQLFDTQLWPNERGENV